VSDSVTFGVLVVVDISNTVDLIEVVAVDMCSKELQNDENSGSNSRRWTVPSTNWQGSIDLWRSSSGEADKEPPNIKAVTMQRRRTIMEHTVQHQPGGL
jgi:hypothetical protein